MKKTMISVCALLLVGATGMMTAGAQGSGNKPTLAVFVVGNMDNTLVSPLAAQLGANLTSSGQYALTPVNTAGKLAELQAAYNAGGGSSINRVALATWGLDNGISAICLVVDDVNGSDHMFYAQLIDAKDSKLSSKGSYIRTGVGTGDLTRVSSALAQQLKGLGRRRSAPAPTRSYPAELDIEMVRVEGGSFKIGCNGTTDGPCYAGDKREVPQRTITLSNFSIGKYLVTRAQWLAVMKGHSTLSNPGSWKDDDQLPIEGVSWLDIDTAFLPRLNALTGRTTTATKYRLATGAEWEYAARGCKAGVCDNYKYSGSDVLGDVAWYTSNAGSRTHPVGQKKPNSLGIYDMSGSVFEWVWDWWDSNYYTNTLKDGDVNPTGPVTGSQPSRGTRSNSWFHDPSFSRNSFRTAFDPSDRRNTIGFRVVLPAQ